MNPLPSMPTHRASRTLPYSGEQMFDLAIDVESYPDYLPGWNSAIILENTGNRLRVEQQLGFTIFTRPVITTAVLNRPYKVNIHSDDAPFRFLSIEWSFEPADHGQCRVSIEFSYRMRSGLLEAIAAKLFEYISPQIIRRFSERARLIYGE